jgi:hypothetical protein
MRKRDSLRRWKKRCQLGRVIPRWAIEEYNLTRWFLFSRESDYDFTVFALCRRCLRLARGFRACPYPPTNMVHGRWPHPNADSIEKAAL